MAMRDDFCAFILTHGRPDRVHTYKTLKKSGYTGKIYIVIDDEDKTEGEYRARFGDRVLQFCKKEIADRIDEGDNFEDRRAIIYARNACWDLAKQVGCKYFIQLDDDYTSFVLRYNSSFGYSGAGVKSTADEMFIAMIDFYKEIPAKSIAMSQGGDHMGGSEGKSPSLRRKCMNSFICDSEKPLSFFGRVNEDVNTYTTNSRKGDLFFTVLHTQLNQLTTQSNSGGMTDMYIDSGTYLKTFYTILYCPSSVQVGVLRDPRGGPMRIHHKINWHNTAPKILREQYKKA